MGSTRDGVLYFSVKCHTVFFVLCSGISLESYIENGSYRKMKLFRFEKFSLPCVLCTKVVNYFCLNKEYFFIMHVK